MNQGLYLNFTNGLAWQKVIRISGLEIIGKLINIIAKRAGGSGGGKPGMALGGTKKIEALDLLLQEARTILIRELKK